ncbi:MAG: HAMP domain-containing sensor histidine kinase [Bacteroidales bacterium]|jgi:two-component system phosphate regulon sensor histidine kinase PhoR
MNRTAIRIVLILGILAITGIISVQFYFIRQAINQENRQLNQTITIALTSVAEDLAHFNDAELPRQSPVFHHSPDYYIVNVNTHIQPEILEQFLVTEFKTRGLTLDFEYGIYDCQTDKMVYGRLVRFGENPKIKPMQEELPKSADYLYYFGIHFAGRNHMIMDSMGIWYFFSFILLLVIIFFAYTQMIILRQRRYAEVQRDFINTMTHEFKTPLASLSMSADVIRKPEILQEPERLFRYGEIIRSQVNHLLKQVELVLEMGGPAGDKLVIKREPVQLRVFISEICVQMEPRIQYSKGTLTLDYQSRVESIEADPLYLTNILLNLLDNALKYSGDLPVIQVSVRDIFNTLVIEIRDRGIGIPPKLKKRVFDKFYRVPTGNIHKTKGFGLGLHFTRNAVKAHGWKIKLESQEGQGTTIQIIIPIQMQ